jgi:FixJ family two-component response regulator
MVRMREDGSKSEPRESAQTDGALVAIVDDDASVRQSTCRLIRSFGHRAESFATGAEFLRSEFAANADCLLLDVRMPGMDGLEVQRTLSQRGARIPILFITGQASEQEERRARAAGAAAFLRKPVSQASLRQALDEILTASGRVKGERDGD